MNPPEASTGRVSSERRARDLLAGNTMSPSEPDLPRPRLLLVEDDRALQESLCELLEDAGFDVVCADNGKEALDYLQGGPRPCVVLLDLMMPVMNGWEFRAQQMRDQKLSDIPVVILSADGRAEMKARMLGADGWLRKPIEMGRLFGVLERYGSL